MTAQLTARPNKPGSALLGEIAGCDSGCAGRADMLAAMDGRRSDEPCLALIHEPDMALIASLVDNRAG